MDAATARCLQRRCALSAGAQGLTSHCSARIIEEDARLRLLAQNQSKRIALVSLLRGCIPSPGAG